MPGTVCWFGTDGGGGSATCTAPRWRLSPQRGEHDKIGATSNGPEARPAKAELPADSCEARSEPTQSELALKEVLCSSICGTEDFEVSKQMAVIDSQKVRHTDRLHCSSASRIETQCSMAQPCIRLDIRCLVRIKQCGTYMACICIWQHLVQWS